MTIDLINNKINDNDLIIDHFPDGQVNIHLGDIDRKDTYVNIITRLRNGDDVILLLMVADIVKRNGLIISKLKITYLYAARMDRIMTFDQPYTLKIIADLINLVGAQIVSIITPHNEYKTANLIKNCISSNPLADLNSIKDGELIVYPDKGAKIRFSKGHFPVCCSKVRNPEDNTLSGFKIESGFISDSTKLIRVYDDLCDGGGTFISIKKMLDKECEKIGIKPEFELVVTHLIQASAVCKLMAIGYDRIITTNSYADWQENANDRFIVKNVL